MRQRKVGQSEKSQAVVEAPLEKSASEDKTFQFALKWACFMVLVAFCFETFVTSGYGRFGEGATISLNPRLGWWLLELPVTLSFVYFFFFVGGKQSHQLVPRILAGIMLFHYSYRGWFFPYMIRVRSGAQNFSAVLIMLGWMVTVTHGYLNAKWFAEHGKHLTNAWLRDPRFIAGVVVYFSGFAALVYHDHILRQLRTEDGPQYKIPHGGLFEYATAAQYFCEIWAFVGFFLLSWGPNGLFILTVTLANLVPRAIKTHEWYLETFGDQYPKDRYYIIPFVF